MERPRRIPVTVRTTFLTRQRRGSSQDLPYILSSSLLTDAIKEDLGVEAVNGSISAQAISESNMITMSVISQSPEDAKAILESAIKVYPDIARFVIGDTRFNIIDEPTMPG